MLVQEIMNSFVYQIYRIFTIEYSPESETGSSLRKKSRLSTTSSLGAADFQTIQEK